MAKHKIDINITKHEYGFIDGQTGEELTQEQFNRKYKKIGGFDLGGNRVKVQKESGQGEKIEN